MDPRQIMQLMKGGGNPQQIIQQMLNNNPQAQQTFRQLQNMAGDMNPRDFAIQLAKQNGMTEQQLMDFAKRFGVK